MSVSYPTEFPVLAAGEIVSIIKGGTVKENVAVLAKDLWIIQGYAQYQLVGEPKAAAASDAATTLGGSLHLESEAVVDYDGLAALEHLCSAEATAESVIDWKSLLLWALQQAVKIWLEHKTPAPTPPAAPPAA